MLPAMVSFAIEVLVAFAALMGVARAVLWWLERRAPRAAKPPPVPTGPPLAGTSIPLPAPLEPHRAELEGILAPSARLEPLGPGADAAAAQLGGSPHLPADEVWPGAPGRPLSFLVELDLAALHARVPTAAAGLPSAGLLQLFYDAASMPFGLDAGDRERFAVLHVPAGGPPRDAPVGTTTFPIRRMTFGRVNVLPVNEEVPGVRLGNRALRSYVGHAFALSGGVDHRVRGFAGWIAQDGREEAALAASGFTVETPKQLAAARRAAHVQVADWRLLLQLDTDPAARFEWGDSGRLYLLARDEDVRAGRFDRTWLLLQCY